MSGTRNWNTLKQTLKNKNKVHLPCAHQCPERSHDTYLPKYAILYTRRAQSYQNSLHKVLYVKTNKHTHYTHTHTHAMTVAETSACVWHIFYFSVSLFLVSDFTETDFSIYSFYSSVSQFLVSDFIETEISAYVRYSLRFSVSLFLVSDLTETETSVYIVSIRQSSGQPKNDTKTLFSHPPSPFLGNFCNCNSGGICTVSQF